MAGITSYRDLDAWQRSMELAEQCYKLTERFPKAEQFGLTIQIRRAAVSIPSNVAEGHNRRSRQAYHSFISIALGSQAELETQLELALRLGYADRQTADPVLKNAAEVGQILHGLSRALEARRDGAK